MRKLLLKTALVLLVAASCARKEEAPLRPSLVVEGWIDSGGHPVVLLSESLPLRDGAFKREDVISRVARWAKVSVDDGSGEVILTGRLDQNYFPPYVYTSSEITGEPGKSYDLKVEYKDYLATARTTIPEPVPLDDIYLTQTNDTTWSVNCVFTDPPQPGQYYRIFAKKTGTDNRYQPAPLAYASDEGMSGRTEMKLWAVQRLLSPMPFPDFHTGDELWIKFCTMERSTYYFWYNYEVSSVTNANGMFWFDSDMDSGLKGAVGYWAGYGASEYKIAIGPKKDDGDTDTATDPQQP